MVKKRLPIKEMTLRQLRNVASKYGISHYSRMRKAQLLEAIQEVELTKDTLNQSDSMGVKKTLETAKFELGQQDSNGSVLANIDKGLADLPAGYDDSRIVVMPRDPEWAYAYWDITNEHKEKLRQQGGQQIALRIYDTTDINLDYQSPHSLQEYPCDELARDWYLRIPVSDRDYIIDIGYRCGDGRWLVLARSETVHIPPVYPSDWIEDVFVNINFKEDLRNKTVYNVTPIEKKIAAKTGVNNIYDQIFDMIESTEVMRADRSLFGSRQNFPDPIKTKKIITSYIFPSDMGMWGQPSTSSINVSGINMSGAGFFASSPLIHTPQFWLIPDAELIVYGTTEPNATVTIGGHPIKLNQDGTFRLQMSFQDGLIDYPIMAVAADGEQTCSIHIKFERKTPSAYINTKEKANFEWPS